MYNLYNKTTLITDYINRILSTFNMPLYKTVHEDDYIVKGCIYFYRRWIIKCTRSGYLGGVKSPGTAYDIISSYTYNEFYPKYTQRFLSNTNYYDNNTHYMLGNYLRVIRDYFAIDLMPFYNCVSYDYTFKFDITRTDVKEGNTKLLQVPIRFDTTYTFAVDCPGAILIKPVVMDRFAIVDDELSKQLKGVKYSNLSFKQPVTLNISIAEFNDNLKERLALREQDLYLLISLPSYENKSIVLIEGDYLNPHRYIIDSDTFNNYSLHDLNKIFLTDLSLLFMNDGITYSFSDRLVEYLTNNVITYEDGYEQDILNIQEALPIYNDNIYPGVFNAIERKIVYDKFLMENKKFILDRNGFVDKDTEQEISRLKQ